MHNFSNEITDLEMKIDITKEIIVIWPAAVVVAAAAVAAEKQHLISHN